MVKKQEILPESSNESQEGSALNDLVKRIQDGTIQGITQMGRGLKKINEAPTKSLPNPITKVKDATPERAGKKTGPKTPITGTNESDGN